MNRNAAIALLIALLLIVTLLLLLAAPHRESRVWENSPLMARHRGYGRAD